MKRNALTALRLFLFLTAVTGVLYPAVITFTGGVLFPSASSGSFVEYRGRTVGSSLVAQEFVSRKYFWPRPSAILYEPVPSGGSNLGPTDRSLRDSLETRRKQFIARNDLSVSFVVPVDMCTASGSGIDPHISPAAAGAQIERVARARGLGEGARKELEALVERYVEPPQLGILGTERVNVLLLNIALDDLIREPLPGPAADSRH
jgi:potassium-transporting ATPase KdpC subunit